MEVVKETIRAGVLANRCLRVHVYTSNRRSGGCNARVLLVYGAVSIHTGLHHSYPPPMLPASRNLSSSGTSGLSPPPLPCKSNVWCALNRIQGGPVSTG